MLRQSRRTVVARKSPTRRAAARLAWLHPVVLVTLECVEDALGGGGDLVWQGQAPAVELDGGRGDRAQGPDASLDGDPDGVLEVSTDVEGGEYHGEVGLDRILDLVEHRAHLEVGLGHPEGRLDVPEIMICPDH